MTTEIKDLLTAAQASARMIAEDRGTEILDDPHGVAAYKAIAIAENSGSAVACAQADAAAEVWVAANEPIARRLIQRRLDVRAASVACRGF